jgi:hypothetical protein
MYRFIDKIYTERSVFSCGKMLLQILYYCDEDLTSRMADNIILALNLQYLVINAYSVKPQTHI